MSHDRVIEVVAAVIVDDGSVLLCQRHEGPHLPLLWEFPGGKIDPGEAPREALGRELTEELEVDSEVGDRIADVRHDYPEKSVRIRFYRARIDGTPRAVVHREVRWIPVEDLHSFAVPPANQSVVDQLQSGSVR